MKVKRVMFHTGSAGEADPIKVLERILPPEILLNVREIHIERLSNMLQREWDEVVKAAPHPELMPPYGTVWQINVTVDKGGPEDTYLSESKMWGLVK